MILEKVGLGYQREYIYRVLVQRFLMFLRVTFLPISYGILIGHVVIF